MLGTNSKIRLFQFTDFFSSLFVLSYHPTTWRQIRSCIQNIVSDPTTDQPKLTESYCAIYWEGYSHEKFIVEICASFAREADRLFAVALYLFVDSFCTILVISTSCTKFWLPLSPIYIPMILTLFFSINCNSKIWFSSTWRSSTSADRTLRKSIRNFSVKVKTPTCDHYTPTPHRGRIFSNKTCNSEGSSISKTLGQDI